ncbi:MAG: SMI1/KNR4 family protein [Planctomycetota bacterium]
MSKSHFEMRKVGPKNPFAVTDPRVKPATERQIAMLEKRIGVKLPKEYRRFLITINGGRRPGAGWELTKHGLAIDTFYGLCRDFHDLAYRVDRVLQQEPGTGLFPSNSLPIASELGGNEILLKFSGKDAGSIWYWDDQLGNERWRKIARGFDAFTSLLLQEVESEESAALRKAIERDDVDAVRQYACSRPSSELDNEDQSTGHSLLQRAANANAAKVARFLINHGAHEIVGLGTVNVRRHTKVLKLLLTRGDYKPTQYDWQGAASLGGLAVLRLYFEHAPSPSRSLLKRLLQNSRNLNKEKQSNERAKVISLLENRLAQG